MRRRRRQLTILSPDEVAKMHTAGQMAARLLCHLGDLIEPGISTQTLNDEAERWADERGAAHAPYNYKGFPRSICTSINEVVCHGIPGDDQILEDGDIISIDVTPVVDGFHGDTCATFFVGDVSEQARKLVEVTAQCLMHGVHQIEPGNRIGDIGAAIQSHAEANGFSVVRDFIGHGVGRTFHGAPEVPHFGRPDTGMRLRPGMAFTVEPMINLGDYDVEVLDDDWTAVTKDRRLSAQFEHTLVVTDEGVDITTHRDADDPERVSPGCAVDLVADGTA